VTIPTDLTLAGAANDTWIFQISGNLTMAAGKRVALSGGAQAKNIVWQVAGSVELGTTAHLEGIVLTQTAPILEQNDKDAFIGELLDEALGLGPLEPILADASVTEVMVVDPATIYIERGGKLELTTTRFTANGVARMQGLITEPYAPFADRVMASYSQVAALTTAAHVADGVWRAVHDDTGQLRFPAGPDAVALAQARL
jgi:hypothetical protein